MRPDRQDRGVKQERIAAVRRASGGGALVLGSHEAVSWYLDGIRTHVSLAGPPTLAVRVDEGGDTLFVAANEADRLIAEELLPDDAERIVRVPWQKSPLLAATEAGSAISEGDAALALRAARASLLPTEIERYRELGRETARVLTDVAAELGPQSSEQEAAALLASGLIGRGIDPLVVLVAGAERVAHRHPLPTGAPLGERAMFVVCGRRHGLIANATRWVGAAGAADGRILEVEAAYLAATRSGAGLDDVFAAGCEAYAASDFAADEWRNHHQGGPTGYAGRDPRATGSNGDRVHENQAFAWNPSAPGAKVEDTMLLTADGFEVLTSDERWPTVEHAGLGRPVAWEWAD
ncbi:Xaa-Pro peptidase family protein [Microbacterium sp.]|uniref:M24 family metallopeptidase n=1 Tax=Microbacterium sp. TaxID=51671 RepID=UPI002732EE5D|nr:M24 family metallopeptidase [Microbacterium sp.]